jgi:hypothetical protein
MAFSKYKARFSGMDVFEARKLNTLEEDNSKLKALLAEQMLDNAMPKEVTQKIGDTRPATASLGAPQCIRSASEGRVLWFKLIDPVCGAP